MKFRTLLLIVSATILMASCEKVTKLEQKHVDLLLLDDWQEFTIGENEEIIMKITLTEETKIDLAWKDEPSQKADDNFTADIVVSAYGPDGITPYFEDKDAGYQEESVMIEIVEGDDQVILIITAADGSSGTFGIRARGITETAVTNPKDLAFGTTWVDKNIAVDDIKWFKVDCGSVTDIFIEWMEFDRPETGSEYTSDIKVSVYSEELDVTYLLDQNHGYGDNARAISLTHSSSIIYIRVVLNDVALPGTFALRAYDQNQ